MHLLGSLFALIMRLFGVSVRSHVVRVVVVADQVSGDNIGDCNANLIVCDSVTFIFATSLPYSSLTNQPVDRKM